MQEDTKHYKMDVFGQELPLKLSLNRHLMSPELRVEVQQGNRSTVFHPRLQNTFYLGKVMNDPVSIVAVSDAEGLVRLH